MKPSKFLSSLLIVAMPLSTVSCKGRNDLNIRSQISSTEDKSEEFISQQQCNRTREKNRALLEIMGYLVALPLAPVAALVIVHTAPISIPVFIIAIAAINGQRRGFNLTEDGNSCDQFVLKLNPNFKGRLQNGQTIDATRLVGSDKALEGNPYKFEGINARVNCAEMADQINRLFPDHSQDGELPAKLVVTAQCEPENSGVILRTAFAFPAGA